MYRLKKKIEMSFLYFARLLLLFQIEEEDFARACIDAFSSGLLSQVAEGTTLRAFLSERLQCQPMRGARLLQLVGIPPHIK